MQYDVNTENFPTKYNMAFFNRLRLLLWQLLLFLMLFVPRTAQEIKGLILVVLLFLALIYSFKYKTILINKKTKTFFSILMTYAILSTVIGMWKGNPGVMGFFRVNVIYFCILTILISSVRNMDSYEKIMKTIFFASNAISIYSIMLLMINIGVWPENYFIYFDVTSNVGLHNGYTHLVNTNLSMMIFIIPFILTLYFNKYTFKIISRKYMLFTLILASVAILISGRRILWLSLLIPIFFLVFRKRNFVSFKKISTLFIATMACLLIYFLISKTSYISLEGLVNRFLEAFKGGEDNIRIIQAKALWKGFLKYPIIGSGAGIGVKDVIRSETSPWLYEMSYNLILYNSGIIGITLYIIGHFYVVLSLYKLKINGDIMAYALLVSYFVVLISNATNPYFSSSFDFLWFIFIPLMYFNFCEVKYKK